MRLVLRAPFDTFSGYGNDAVDMALALDKQGVDVLPWPITVLPGLPERFAQLLMKDPRGAKDAVLTFAPPFDVRPWEFANMAPVSIGWSMWERTPMQVADLAGPEHRWDVRDPIDKADRPYTQRAVDKRAWEGLNRMLVTCPMNVAAFRALDEVTPMDVLPCGIDPDKWPVEPRPPERQMTFLMVGMLGGRKNPFAVLNAWRELKAEYPEFDARLHLHTLAPGLHPGIADGPYGPDITISNKPLSHQELTGLYLSADVLVSTSRGEGNNKPAMEFMATGGTVIAPKWGGHENWMHRDVTIEVPFELMQSADGWADATVDHDGLKQAMLAAWGDRAGTSLRGRNAAPFIRSSLSWESVVQRLVKTIEGER